MSKLLDSFESFLGADMPQTDKLTQLCVTFLTSAQGGEEQRGELLASVLNWLLSLEEVPDEEMGIYCELGEYVSKLAGEETVWLSFNMLRAQFLIEQKRMDEAIPRINMLLEQIPDDENLQNMSRLCEQYRTNAFKTHSDSMRTGRKIPGCDNEFYSMIDQLKKSSINELLGNAATWVNKWVEEDYEYYGLLLKYYRSWYGVGVFGQDQGFIKWFSFVYQYWKKNADELVWLYEELEDYRSKMTLRTMLQHWMTFHPDLRQRGREVQFEHYFDFDVIKCDENEVFVDCGCFDGNTVKDFIRCYGPEYKRIYSYELTPSTYEIAKANLKDIPRLCLRNAGVSDKNGRSSFLDKGSALAGANQLTANGNAIASVVRIDDDIQEDVTFIKMDVEGAECAALRGAENQIRRNRPKLAISLYHKVSDLIEIPRIIKSFVPEYKLYLRQFVEKGFEEIPFPVEYVLLAVAD